MDSADPAPLRYLGELYRHHLGDWDQARQTFEAILAMPADPLSRAVALHGLGKMTIHEGEFLKGLHLMEDSVREYPLALAYRNLAVYWNSEGDSVKADYYTREATKSTRPTLTSRFRRCLSRGQRPPRRSSENRHGE